MAFLWISSFRFYPYCCSICHFFALARSLSRSFIFIYVKDNIDYGQIRFLNKMVSKLNAIRTVWQLFFCWFFQCQFQAAKKHSPHIQSVCCSPWFSAFDYATTMVQRIKFSLHFSIMCTLPSEVCPVRVFFFSLESMMRYFGLLLLLFRLFVIIITAAIATISKFFEEEKKSEFFPFVSFGAVISLSLWPSQIRYFQ